LSVFALKKNYMIDTQVVNILSFADLYEDAYVIVRILESLILYKDFIYNSIYIILFILI